MSRQEDFDKAAMDYCEDHSHCIYFEAGAEYGYQYAQAYPNWISVDDELPKEHFVDTSSKWVLVSIKGSVFIDSYNHKHKEWVNNGKCVDHWMPIPQPPRKED